MFSVHVCPSNQTEIDESSRRIGCGKDKYGNTQYMCISNGNKTSLVEFCFNGTMGLEEKGMSFSSGICELICTNKTHTKNINLSFFLNI